MVQGGNNKNNMMSNQSAVLCILPIQVNFEENCSINSKPLLE